MSESALVGFDVEDPSGAPLRAANLQRTLDLYVRHSDFACSVTKVEFLNNRGCYQAIFDSFMIFYKLFMIRY